MATFNLIRKARMFFSTNVSQDTGALKATGFTVANTREIQVLDGLSFSQATGSETVTISEAGDAPARGQRSFNTSLEPVELTFSTYIRPSYYENTATTGADSDDYIDAEEDVLWNAMFAGAQTDGSDAIGGGNAAWVRTAGNPTGPVLPTSILSMTNSGKNQLQKFAVIIILDDLAYVINNCVVDQAVIDFGLDAIATIAWTVRGSTLKSYSSTEIACGTSTATDTGRNNYKYVTLSGTFFTGTGTTADHKAARAKNTAAAFLANKVSTVTLYSKIKGATNSGTQYSLALTGGSLTLSNNVTYLTPANLGVVNQPVTYFTGTRAISGSINCYLKTGSTNSAGLLAQMLTDSATTTEPAFELKLAIGGSGNTNKVEVYLPATTLTIPAINTEQVISSTINFTGQGYSGSSGSEAFDFANNEATIQYFATTT